MINRKIPYKSIIMRCVAVDRSAYREPDDEVEIAFYQTGMETVWAEIQKNVGEFQDKTVSETAAYFMDKYGADYSELERRCVFLKDRKTGRFIGSCMAWFDYKDEKKISVLHWLAVDDRYAGKGYARILITKVMTVFESLNEGDGIYLHTQPYSYPAIKLYLDFGFQIARRDCYGNAKNEYVEAMQVLKEWMRPTDYQKLMQRSTE